MNISHVTRRRHGAVRLPAQIAPSRAHRTVSRIAHSVSRTLAESDRLLSGFQLKHWPKYVRRIRNRIAH